jgi:hypothetical protein
MRPAYDAPADEVLTLDGPAFDRATYGLTKLLAPLWPELVERARRPRGERGPWPAIERLTREEQYLVGLALDCAAVARFEIARVVMARYVLEVRLGAAPPRVFRPDVDVRRRLVGKAKDAEERMTVNEDTSRKVN